MGVTWIAHKGKRILFSNYEGCKTSEEMINILLQEVEILKKQENKTLVLANYTGSFGSEEYMKVLKEAGIETLSKKIEKTATMGITGIKEAFFKSYIFFTKQKNVKLFHDRDEALDWLTQ